MRQYDSYAQTEQRARYKSVIRILKGIDPRLIEIHKQLNHERSESDDDYFSKLLHAAYFGWYAGAAFTRRELKKRGKLK